MLVAANARIPDDPFTQLVARSIRLRGSGIYLLVAEMVKQIGDRPLAGDDGT